jgi:hypothetical protein
MPPEQDRCQGQPECPGIPVLEMTLANLITYASLTPLRVCSQCAAGLLIVHAVYPEGAPSPFRVAHIGMISQESIRATPVAHQPV